MPKITYLGPQSPVEMETHPGSWLVFKTGDTIEVNDVVYERCLTNPDRWKAPGKKATGTKPAAKAKKPPAKKAAAKKPSTPKAPDTPSEEDTE